LDCGGQVCRIISANIRKTAVKYIMIAEELQAKRLAPGFRSRNALAKGLGGSKYPMEHWKYGRRAIPGWVSRLLQ